MRKFVSWNRFKCYNKINEVRLSTQIAIETIPIYIVVAGLLFFGNVFVLESVMPMDYLMGICTAIAVLLFILSNYDFYKILIVCSKVDGLIYINGDCFGSVSEVVINFEIIADSENPNYASVSLTNSSNNETKHLFKVNSRVIGKPILDFMCYSGIQFCKICYNDILT
jgi:hypothetical protein